MSTAAGTDVNGMLVFGERIPAERLSTSFASQAMSAVHAV
jgi:hypothetical protein